jgi:hypothetical protein
VLRVRTAGESNPSLTAPPNSVKAGRTQCVAAILSRSVDVQESCRKKSTRAAAGFSPLLTVYSGYVRVSILPCCSVKVVALLYHLGWLGLAIGGYRKVIGVLAFGRLIPEIAYSSVKAGRHSNWPQTGPIRKGRTSFFLSGTGSRPDSRTGMFSRIEIAQTQVT